MLTSRVMDWTRYFSNFDNLPTDITLVQTVSTAAAVSCCVFSFFFLRWDYIYVTFRLCSMLHYVYLSSREVTTSLRLFSLFSSFSLDYCEKAEPILSMTNIPRGQWGTWMTRDINIVMLSAQRSLSVCLPTHLNINLHNHVTATILFF